jgi:DNA-directed RNA polymerase specialized sigma24 family protein
MASRSKLEPSKYDLWFAKKSDDWLVDVLRGENKEDINLAWQVLENRHKGWLERYVYNQVRWHQWVESDDILQETFLAFFCYVQGNQVKKSVRALLKQMAYNKSVDALKKQERERLLESDIPVTDYIDVEVDLEWREEQKQAEQLYFTKSLTRCQRIVFLLTELYGYPRQIVARLMDKRKGTIYTHLDDAWNSVEIYLKSMDYDLDCIALDLSTKGILAIPRQPDLVIERFAKNVCPQFTPEELKPLGLTPEEFQNNYVASLMMPWEPYSLGEKGGLSVILTRQEDAVDVQKIYKRLRKDPGNVDEIFPEECLIKIDEDNGNLVLTPKSMVEILPEKKGWLDTPRSDNTYLSIHRFRKEVRIPAILGYLDQSLFTPELYQRWPFVTPDMGI